MTTNINVRAYGTTQNTRLLRQRVARRPLVPESVTELRKPVAIVAGAALLLVLVFGQIISWQAGKSAGEVKRLQAEAGLLADENMRLRAQRAQLRSKTHIEAIAGARLNLFSPGKKQVYHL